MRVNIADTHVSGHVVLRQGARGPVYYLKYRLPDGRQVKRRLGKAWTERGRAPASSCVPGTGCVRRTDLSFSLNGVIVSS